MKNNGKILLFIIFIFLVLIIYLYPKYSNDDSEITEYERIEGVNNFNNDNQINIFKENDEYVSENVVVENDENNKLIPESKVLDVQFIPQAPFGDWSEPWQNACEEAAIMTVHYAIKNKEDISRDQIKNEIEQMVAWQINSYGIHKDLNVEEIAEFAKEYYRYSEVLVLYDISIKDIKEQIAKGNPVIVPAAGRILDNPNFTQPGPIYHNLVVIGYTPDKIITNDPGTRNGEKFEYSYENFYQSIHDFVEGANENPDMIMRGGKAMIIIKN